MAMMSRPGMAPLEIDPAGEFAMNDDIIESTVHELAQQLQIVAMILAAIERRDGDDKLLAPARRALERLDRGLEELAALARRSAP